MKRGKRYVEAAKAIDRATLYDTADAIALVKKAVGDKEISVGITGSENLSADEIKNCKTALEKLGFTDIRFE